jgi:hypothetical protein
MKKIKLKSLVDRTSNTNIDDIYSDICKELGINNDKNNIIKQIESKTKNSKTPLKYSIPIKKNDEDLLLSMTKRLNIVEQNLKEANLKLKKKDEEIIKLNIKIKELEKIKKEKEKENLNITCENCAQLNKIIEQQNEYITKLYNFMKENGILISKSIVDPKSQEEINKKLKDLQNELNELNLDNEYENNEYDKSLLPKTIDIKVLERRIDEMNAIIYEEQGNNAQFESEDGKIFKLKQKKEILISFYKNGLIIEGYQFFPYESETSQKIIQDIIDGYSPYILHDRYPHGVLMKIENHVKILYEPNINKNIKNLNDPGEQTYMSPKEFVNIFPNKIIKNGNILNIKEDMEKILNINKDESNNKDNSKNEENEFNLYDEKNKEIKDEDLCKLKIKVVTVDKIINIKIPKNKHINELFDFVKKYVNDNLKKISSTLKINNINDYGFIMTFPFKILFYDKNKNKENTLDKCGLYPSLFITFDVISKYQQK